MLKWIVGAAMLAACALPAQAQNYVRITNCGDARPPAGASQGYMDSHGNVCGTAPAAGMIVAPLPYTSSGTMSVTAASQSVGVGAGLCGVPATLPNNYIELRPELEFAGVANSLNTYVCPGGGPCTTSTTGVVALAPGQSKTFRWTSPTPTLPTVIATGAGGSLYCQW